ncbi:hypothetical protein [Hymenobacter convexus]|uniref:hypothetical protein n=1 Tax=Hymenobacter sp. CA1UV-4 TaxID=3063782 RepID=UPI0027126613|nr:hypothetical protein [Hymenobacter sp. CA1UV-4]MDO7853147.1 hypothetical protein [Hymenobacter sp. CA1UV-4]
MNTLQIGTTTKQVPSTWNEMTRRQLLQVLAHFYGTALNAGWRLEMLSLLTDFQLPLLCALESDVLAQLLPLTDFVLSDDHRLTAQLLPTLRIPGRHWREGVTTWHGPRASFSNLTFGEFMFADTFFVQYHLLGQRVRLNNRSTYLDQFLAVLYRPARRVTVAGGMVEQNASPTDPDWNGDVRVPFNEHQLELRTPRVAALPEIEKLAVLTWYRGCRAQLAVEFPDVFAMADEDDKRPQKGPQWEPVLRKLSGGAFGTVQQTAGQPARLILAEMQDLAVQYQERLKAQKATS